MESFASSVPSLCTANSPESLPEQMDEKKEAAKSVFEALKCLPLAERSSVDEARHKAPQLVLEETEPLMFLKHDGGDARAAAERLAAFWRKRVELFEERAFLPFATLTGEGALNHDDIETLKTGYKVILPDASAERTVFFFDCMRANSQGLDTREARMSRFRCLFYLLWKAAFLGKPALYIRYTNNAKFDPIRARNFHVTLESIPLHIDRILCLYAPPRGGKRIFQETVVPLYENFLGKNNFAMGALRSYVGESPEEFLGYLLKEGCSKEHLPELVGGTWTYDAFDRWVEQQMSMEPKTASTSGTSTHLQTPKVSAPSRLSARLFSVTRECLATSSEDMSGKLLLMNLLKSERESRPRGAIARIPHLEPSDPSSELGRYMQGLNRKRSCESDLEDRLLDSLQCPPEAQPVPDTNLAQSILGYSLGRTGTSAIALDSSSACRTGEPATVVNGHTNESSCQDGKCVLTDEDMDQLLAGLSEGPRPSKQQRTTYPPRDSASNGAETYVNALLNAEHEACLPCIVERKQVPLVDALDFLFDEP